MKLQNPFKDQYTVITSIYGILVATITGIAFYIRCLPKADVFGGSFVKFGGNDPWYNMRIVENTLTHFPHRINFDAYTYFPHGQYHPFAFLFDQILAFIIWVAGLGSPSHELMELIGAYYPAVLGALTVIPVYIIGKEIYNRNVGILSAALIAVLPGQFLSRSLLGFTDHHVMETLFATWVIAFFVIAVKSAQDRVTLDHILNKDLNHLKKPIFYSILTGIMLGSYILAWKGGVLSVFVILVYLLLQAVIDHMKGKDLAWLLLISIPAFMIAILMILPYIHPSTIDIRTVAALSASILGVAIFAGISHLLRVKEIERAAYPFVLIVLAGIGLFAFSIIAPDLYHSMTAMFNVFSPKAGALTVAEVHPMHVFGTSATNPGAWEWFTTPFFIAFIAYAWIVYNLIFKDGKGEELLLITWSALMLYASFGQNRFAAYYAINVAILTGFISWKFIEFGLGSQKHEPVKADAKKRHEH
ncbi:MAG: STT3 domain-containing protein, partial [Candidatus Syntropharchaeales archaeon]